ncbi:MAG: hypothetical protein AAF449_12190 [Myxococcota bacterium]
MHHALRDFGFNVPALRTELFERADQVIRMGYPPLRVEILTSIDGVAFDDCYPKRIQDNLGDTRASIIGLACLKANKRASGRYKDLSDLEHLP